ncbi:MAG TPA: hypothetical protein VMS32_03935 [Verrucomicrobiae bacterium]|jgi:hypothetical protein|nr:hypothetical protein [Verrucomicrobiae bacterium]
MLLRTVVVVALIAMLAMTIVQACAALGRAAVHRTAAQAADDAFADDLAEVKTELATAIAGGADPRTVTIAPTPQPTTCAVATAGGCALSIGNTILATTASPVGDLVEDPASCAPRCASNVQENDAIAEGRIAVAIHVTVTGASGEIFARRERYALFRTLRVPPYAALVGTRDATDEAVASGASTGDDAGLPATVVNVRYVNATTGASTDANAWQSRGWDDGGSNTTAWDP